MKRTLYTVLKILIAFGSGWFIYYKVISRPDFGHMMIQLEETFFNEENLLPAILILILMIFNWLIESFKWKLLLKKVRPSGILFCIRSVLTGVTISMFTPNRTGEFAGKVLHLPSENRVVAAIASIIGSTNQLLVTIVAGASGLILILPDIFDESISMRYFINAAIIIAVIILVLFYFRMSVLHRIVKHFTGSSRLELYTRIFENYALNELLIISLLSVMRYVIFTLQYIMILRMFGVETDLLTMITLISVIYLVLALVPSIAISELTTRGSVALYFLAPVAGNGAGILVASSLLWLINLVIPALAGALTVFYFRFNK